ncbi:MAG: hypothetical protein P4L11_13695 [Geothrix sp.]|nr:hypothetical protein [Geothrix sp.]
MMSIDAIEQEAVTNLIALNLPELQGFAIGSLAGQVDLENDQLQVATPNLLIAVVGAHHVGTAAEADTLQMAFVAVVPGSDQMVRRQTAMDALMAVRRWMDEYDTPYAPTTTRTERLHPMTVAALFANRIG